MLCGCCEKRQPDIGFCCVVCLDRMTKWLGAIPTLYSVLVEAHTADPTPTARTNAYATLGTVVGGSREPPVPIDLDVLDLVLNVQYSTTWGHEYSYLEDQVGYVPILTELDRLITWAHFAWFPTDPLPVHVHQEVANEALWLRLRLERLCGLSTDVQAVYGALRRCHGALVHALGEDAPRAELVTGRCVKCRFKTLYRNPESEFVECANCAALLTLDEYEAQVSNAVTKEMVA